MSYYDDYIKSLQQAQQKRLSDLAAKQKAEEDKINAQYAGRVEDINAQKPLLEQRFTDNAQAAYVQNMKSKRDLGQQLAANGYTGGLSETSRLALESQYGKNYNNLNRDYNNNLDNLQNQINQLGRDKAAALADLGNQYQVLISDTNESYAGQIAQARLQAEQEAIRQRELQEQIERERQALAEQRAYEERKAAEQRAYEERLRKEQYAREDRQRAEDREYEMDKYWATEGKNISTKKLNQAYSDILSRAQAQAQQAAMTSSYYRTPERVNKLAADYASRMLESYRSSGRLTYDESIALAEKLGLSTK